MGHASSPPINLARRFRGAGDSLRTRPHVPTRELSLPQAFLSYGRQTVSRQTVSYYLGNSRSWIVRPADGRRLNTQHPVAQNRPIAASGAELVLQNDRTLSGLPRSMRQGCAEIFLGAVLNAVLLPDFWFVAHPEASMPPVAGTPGSTFFDVCRAFFPTDLVGCSNPLGHAR